MLKDMISEEDCRCCTEGDDLFHSFFPDLSRSLLQLDVHAVLPGKLMKLFPQLHGLFVRILQSDRS